MYSGKPGFKCREATTLSWVLSTWLTTQKIISFFHAYFNNEPDLPTDNLPYEQIGKKEPVCIADEVPFEIPDSWEWVRLSTIIELQSGQDLTSDKYNSTGQGIPYITGASNIENNSVIINRWTEYGRAFAYKGDLLLTCKGTVGTMAFLEKEQVHIARQIMAIRPVNGVEPQFLRLVLESSINALKKAAKSMIPGISRDDVLSTLMAVPPLQEQHRIISEYFEVASFILKYDEVETALCRLNSIFPNALKKSILQWTVQGKLVPQDPNDEPASVLLERIRSEKEKLIKDGKIKRDKHESVIYRRDNSHYEKLDGIERCIDDEIPFDIPSSWEWQRLRSVISLISGTDFKPEDYNDSGHGTPYITGASSLSDKTVIVSRWTDTPKNMAYEGDILLVCKGSGYGKTVICDVEKAHIARQIMAIRKTDYFNMTYIKFFLQMNIRYLKSMGQGVIPGIDRNSVLQMLLPIPPIREQNKIVSKIEKLFSLVKVL